MFLVQPPPSVKSLPRAESGSLTTDCEDCCCFADGFFGDCRPVDDDEEENDEGEAFEGPAVGQ